MEPLLKNNIIINEYYYSHMLAAEFSVICF